MILDTSVLIDILRGNVDEETVNRLDSGNRFKTTSITVMELWEGIQQAERSEKEEEKVEELIEKINSIDFESLDGRKAAEINQQLSSRGEIIDLEDVMISAIALNRGESVATSNHRDFEKVEGLEVVSSGEV